MGDQIAMCRLVIYQEDIGKKDLLTWEREERKLRGYSRNCEREDSLKYI